MVPRGPAPSPLLVIYSRPEPYNQCYLAGLPLILTPTHISILLHPFAEGMVEKGFITFLWFSVYCCVSHCCLCYTRWCLWQIHMVIISLSLYVDRKNIYMFPKMHISFFLTDLEPAANFMDNNDLAHISHVNKPLCSVKRYQIQGN